ncbi:phage tail sheath family protein [Bacillus sp. BRMEA1]|uniref:phage tail sheath family protein n=1 Tax=Neobacillus endophyticus TaxID=2738405 RepID=UPI001565DD20|nr:phage tail sheath family protein [Neobacillus endophyticus]NRD80285.1 phage tail sheath family protein [Neobacillus endophyticus]
MQFINNLNGLTVDDQYFMEVPVTQGGSDAPTGNIGLVGTFSRGPLNTPVLVTSYQQLVKQFGEVDSALALTGTLEARGIFKQGNANVYVVRIDGKTANASAAASVVLKDSQSTPGTVLTLTAATNGTWANSLNAVVSAGTLTGTFRIDLQYGDESESWDNLVIQQPGTPIAGAVLASTVFGTSSTQMGQSKLVYGTFPGTPNTNTPKAGTYTLTGGADGAGATTTDYIGANTGGVKTGLYALDSAPINLVVAAGQSDPTVNAALITNANTVTQSGGLPRIALITFPKGTAIGTLSSLLSSYNSDRAIAVYPWVQIAEPITSTTPTVSPLGYMAGLLAQLDPQKSTGNKTVYGILGADPSLIIGAQDLATMAGLQVNAIGVPTPAGPIGVRGGFSLDKSGVSNQLYVRRMKDYIDQTVFMVGGQFVDEPITDDLMRQVVQAVDNKIRPMKEPNSAQDKMIADYKIICDKTNNPDTSIAQNRLICDYAVKLLNMDRFMIFRTQIGSGVIITSAQGQ